MTLAFPLSTSSFADVLRFSSVKFKLSDSAEYSGLGSGQLVVANLSPRYWTAEIGLINMPQDDALEVQALIESMDGGISDFYLYDTRCKYPKSDPTGALIDGYTPEISNLRSNNKELGISGLPDNFRLTIGDMLHFNYGPSDEYRALHRIVRTADADGDGQTGWVEVRPHIEEGAEVGARVYLVKPSARMKILPGSFDEGRAQQMMTTGMGFKARQVP